MPLIMTPICDMPRTKRPKYFRTKHPVLLFTLMHGQKCFIRFWSTLLSQGLKLILLVIQIWQLWNEIFLWPFKYFDYYLFLANLKGRDILEKPTWVKLQRCEPSFSRACQLICNAQCLPWNPCHVPNHQQLSCQAKLSSNEPHVTGQLVWNWHQPPGIRKPTMQNKTTVLPSGQRREPRRLLHVPRTTDNSGFSMCHLLVAHHHQPLHGYIKCFTPWKMCMNHYCH